MGATTVRLRAHHLLCLLTYVGRGYSPAFVANMDAVARRLGAGAADILVVEGPDDLCAPLRGTGDDHCLAEGARARDARAAADIAARLGRPIGSGTRLPAAVLADLRPGFAGGTLRGACAGCPWADLCDTVAGAGFSESRLKPSGIGGTIDPSRLMAVAAASEEGHNRDP